MKSRIVLLLIATAVLFFAIGSCTPTSDEVQSDAQEGLLKKLLSGIGMPSITNGREVRMMNKVLEDRDHTIATWTYMWSDYNRCYTLIGASVAYPIPYATQRTNPMRVSSNSNGRIAIPQADPNGLYSPANAEGTFLEMNDPSKTNETGVVYSEPRLTTSPFEFPDRIICPPLEKPTAKEEPKVKK